MKKLASLMLAAGLLLSGCGNTPPPQISGNNSVGIGVSVDDSNSVVNVTRTYTPAVVDANGNVIKPATTVWLSDGSPAIFKFMSRPGSHPAYITGYRITRSNYNGSVSTTLSEEHKMDLYVPSGYTCPERESLPNYQSCMHFTTDGNIKQDTVQANGLPVTASVNFANTLVSEVQRTLSDAYGSVDLEFVGYSGNGQPVSVVVKGVSFRAVRLGN